MTRRTSFASGKSGPAFVDKIEHQARAAYLLMRRLPGTDLVITDAGLYPTRGSDGLRAAADTALLVELEASLQVLT